MKKTILFLYTLITCHSAFSMDEPSNDRYDRLYKELKKLRKEMNHLNNRQRESHRMFKKNLLRSMALSSSSLMLFSSVGYVIARNLKYRYDYYTRHKISEALKKYGIIFCRLTPAQKEAITILVTQSRHQFHTYAKYRTKKQKQELCQRQFFAALTELYFGKAPTRYLLSRFYKRTGLRTNHS